jgi:cystathionine beta-lyase
MKSDTLATHLGRDPEKNHGIVNPPVYHASTVLFPTVEKLKETERRRLEPGHTHYGRMGTPTSFALEGRHHSGGSPGAAPHHPGWCPSACI